MLTVLALTLIVLLVSSTASAQTPPAAACAPAGSSIRIEARASGHKPVDVTYVVENRRRERLRWVRISAPAPLVVNTSAQFLKMPADWRGTIEASADAPRVDVAWTALTDDAAIGQHKQASFSLRGSQRYMLRTGATPLDFTAVPFTAADDAGHCWSGITDSGEYSDIGVVAGINGGAVRVITDQGTTRVLVEYPAGEAQFRVTDRAFVVVPVALTWGVKGGFSVDGSIGIGLSVLPTRHVALYAKTNIGTALFNNVTHLRNAGVDFNIPIGRTTFAEGLSRQNRFLVVGIEYFYRHVSKLAGFLNGPQWYASGRGVALRIGIRSVSWDLGP
jgi:hypothetical protein